MAGYGYAESEDFPSEPRYRTFAPLFFNVEGEQCPRIQVASPENIIYDNFDVPLNFTVKELVSQISYSLDGHENVTIAENTTLTNLPNGGHNVTVYTKDKAGNIKVSETIFFNVDKPEPLEPFPITIVIALTALVTVISLGLLVYFKKHKR